MWKRLTWGLAGVLPLASFTVVMLLIYTQQQQSAIKILLQEAGIGSAHVVDLSIREQIGLLNGLAASSALDSGDFEAFRVIAERLWSMHPEWRTIILTDEHQQLLNLRFPPGKALPPVQDRASLTKVWTTGQPVVGDLANGYVAIRIPVIRSDRVIYTLVAPTDPQYFLNALHLARKTAHWGIIVAGGDDVVILASAGAPVTTGEQLPPSFLQNPSATFDHMRYGSAIPINSGAWRVFVSGSAASVEAPFLKKRAVLYLGGFLATLLTASLVLAFGSAWAARQETSRLREEIDRRKREEAESQRLAQQRQLALDAARMGWWSYDPGTGISSWDERYREIFGVTGYRCSNEEILSRLHPEDLPAVWARVEAALDPVNPQPYSAEYRIALPDGTMRWIEAHGLALFEENGEIQRATGLVGTVTDITERKLAEEALRASLAEKVALLNEVHHRVKNNLQIVASLLSLQASHTDSQDVVKVLHDTRNRVRSMALLHEVLYSSGNLARINFAAYVRELCIRLLRSFGPSSARINLENHVASIGLALEQAVPCGLIINELVSNSLKHGFPGGRCGQVLVELRPNDKDRIILCVRDDGVGLPPDFDLAGSSSLGLKLVSNLAGQVGGQLSVERPREGGAIFTVVFPVH